MDLVVGHREGTPVSFFSVVQSDENDYLFKLKRHFVMSGSNVGGIKINATQNCMAFISIV